MKKIIITAGIIVFLISCGTNKTTTNNSNSKRVNNQSLNISGISKDETYGYEKSNPVKVGGVSSGPINERKYLNALTGPNGEELSYYRAGSCCAFKTSKGFLGSGLLDIYKVVWEGSKDTLTLYLNMYDKAKLKAPVGFGIK